MTDKLTTQYNI